MRAKRKLPPRTTIPRGLLLPYQLRILKLLSSGLTRGKVAEATGSNTTNVRHAINLIIKILDAKDETDAVYIASVLYPNFEHKPYKENRNE